MAKVIDSTLYFNEIEMFCLRYDLLKDVVDLFCVFEAGTTFTGLSKSNNFWADLLKSGFDFDQSRIRYYKIDNLPDRMHAEESCSYKYELDRISEIPKTDGEQWFKEHLSRELLKRMYANECDSTIVLVSDIDEIPKPQSVREACRIIIENPDSIVSFKMADYLGSLSCRIGDEWNGTFALQKIKSMQSCLSAIRFIDPLTRERSAKNLVVVSSSGWHLSGFGGSEKVKQKILAWGHQELNRWDIKFAIGANLALKKDIFGRDLFKISRRGYLADQSVQLAQEISTDRFYRQFIVGEKAVKSTDYIIRLFFVCFQLLIRLRQRVGL